MEFINFENMKLLKYLFLVPAALNLSGQLLGSNVMTDLSKPLLMPLLALSVWLLMKDHGVRGPRVKTIILALLFGAIGDVLLMVGGTGWFLAGMLAFLIGHVFYFCSIPAPWKVKGISGKIFSLLLLACLIAGVVSLAGKFPVEGFMKTAVTLYACAFAFLIHACIVAAVDRKCPLYFLVALGFAVFAFSDTFVAIGAFTDLRVPQRGFIVMSTYILAQAVVAFTLAFEEVRELEKTEYGVRVRRL